MSMKLFAKLGRLARRFATREDGNMSLEAVFFVPLFITVIAGTYSLYDGFRYKALNTKATYTISDALSRETDPINDAYLDGMVEVMEYLTRSEGPYSLRVTVVRFDAEADAYLVEWSQTRGTFAGLSNSDVAGIRDKLPNMLDNERVVVVETQTEYESPFQVEGFNTDDLFYNFAFTRPRFAPQLIWSGV